MRYKNQGTISRTIVRHRGSRLGWKRMFSKRTTSKSDRQVKLQRSNTAQRITSKLISLIERPMGSKALERTPNHSRRP